MIGRFVQNLVLTFLLETVLSRHRPCLESLQDSLQSACSSDDMGFRVIREAIGYLPQDQEVPKIKRKNAYSQIW